MTQTVNPPSSLAPKARAPYFDNLRAFLIFMVVTGHLLECFSMESFGADLMFKWIYSFHMPAFLFVSGLFAKSVYQNSRFKAGRVLEFFLIYITFQTVFYLFERLVLGNPVRDWISYFTPRTGLWYIFTVMLYMICIPLFAKLHPLVPICVFGATSLIVGFDNDADIYMSFSRFCTMGPFFWAGYGLDAQKLSDFRGRKWVPFAGLAALALGTVAIVWFNPQIPPLLLAGKSSYALMEIPSRWAGMLHRLLWYLLALVMVFGIMAVTPKRNLFYSYVGSRTLQIYIFQAMLAQSFIKMQWLNHLAIADWLRVLIAFGLGLAATFLFSVKIFEYPFIWLKKLAGWLMRQPLFDRTAKLD